MSTLIGRVITISLLSLAFILFYFIKPILIIASIVLLYILIKHILKIRMQKIASVKLLEKNAEIIQEVENNHLLDILYLEGFIPAPNEVVFLMQDAEIYNALPPENKTGNFESISVPLPLHLRINLGRFGIKQRPKYNFVSGGFGRLYLTNERIIFISEFSNEIIKLNKILNVENLNNGARIDIENKKPIKFITGDIRFFVTYEKFRREYRNFEHLKAWSKKRT